MLRTDTSGDPAFAELLARVREADLAAYAHQDLPFERLVEQLNPARSLARHPLFQVMLVLQNNAAARIELPGLAAALIEVGTGTAKFDLVFAFAERRDVDGTPQGLDGIIEYASDLFDEPTVESIARRLVRLLEAVAADPGQRDRSGRDPQHRRAAPDPRRVERHRPAGGAGDPAGAVRGPGRKDPGCHRPGVRSGEPAPMPSSTPGPTGWRIT